MGRQGREFLRRAGWIGSAAVIAGMPEGAKALAGIDAGMPGRSGVIESSVLPQQETEPPKAPIKFGVCGMSHDHITLE